MGGARKWSLHTIFATLALASGCAVAALALAPHISTPHTRRLLLIVGVVGLWRYLWWMTHLVRAVIYGAHAFPALRARADRVWTGGWRPRRIHVLMTTFRERPETAAAVVAGLCGELRAAGRPAIVWIGSAEAADEATLIDAFRRSGNDLDIDLRIIRQNLPGKRVALALLLRAAAREGLGPDDIVALMDGDFVLEPGALTRCLPLFAVDPKLHAVTTDEEPLVIGPAWMQSWLSMRFAQRRIGMQSHSLSGRVLTLTGRFSVFRATHIVEERFIRLLEADHLDHWLWGRFRFLSGDDKSTWYALLQQGVRMLYVPDARGYTVEVIEGDARTRMVENLRRWSGNVLRNGWRAIRLGPLAMPPFIWWCLIDQRIAIWTTLLGPLLALIGVATVGPLFLLGYVVYLVATRLAVSLVLFVYSPRADLNYVWCLYLNQLVNAGVKLYILWRLPQQRWSNRGNQRASGPGGRIAGGLRRAMAGYLTLVSCAALVLAAILISGVGLPRWQLSMMLLDWLQ